MRASGRGFGNEGNARGPIREEEIRGAERGEETREEKKERKENEVKRGKEEVRRGKEEVRRWSFGCGSSYLS